MTDFSLANMDYTPVRFMIKCFEANYPESLGAVLVHKAPWIFQGVWKIIRGWLDPVVASKVHFTNDLADLSAFIDEKNVIKELGGPNEWQYKYEEPKEGENAAMKDTTTRDRLKARRWELSREYENVVLEWIGDGVVEGPNKEPVEGAGGKATEEYRRRRDELARQLRENYWELDPYVRARSVYDRLGLLRPGSRMGEAPG
jgi:CRAL/TRIO domain